MSNNAIRSVLSSAAHRRATVSLAIRSDSGEEAAEVEPYSILKRSGVLTLFCWDTTGNRVMGLPMDTLVRATPTSRKFTPRYEIEL